MNKILLLTEDAGIYFCTLCYLSDESLRVEKHYYIFAYVKKAIDLFSRFFVFKKVSNGVQGVQTRLKRKDRFESK